MKRICLGVTSILLLQSCTNDIIREKKTISNIQIKSVVLSREAQLTFYHKEQVPWYKRLPVNVQGVINNQKKTIQISLPVGGTHYPLYGTQTYGLLVTIKGDFSQATLNMQPPVKDNTYRIPVHNIQEKLVLKVRSLDNMYADEYDVKLVNKIFRSEIPEIYNVQLKQNFIDEYLSELVVKFEYADPNFDPPGPHQFYFFSSLQPKTNFVLASRGTNPIHRLTEDDINKYFLVQVIPFNADLTIGRKVLSEVTNNPIQLTLGQNIRDSIKISAIGNNPQGNANNDYVLLFNTSQHNISLERFYLGRDSNCDLSNGWTEYISLSGHQISARSYLLVGRPNNTISADILWTNGSINSSGCILLSTRQTPEDMINNNDNVDFISFGQAAYQNEISQGSLIAMLRAQQFIRRRGKCLDQDTNSNDDDFYLDNADFEIPNRSTLPCNTEVNSQPDSNGVETQQNVLVISSVGNAWNNVVSNDYIVLYNNSEQNIQLNQYYIALDRQCEISSGNWYRQHRLPNHSLNPGKYFLITRSNSTLNADWKWNITIDSEDCLVISSSSSLPTKSYGSHIIDFVSFYRNTGESNTYPGSLMFGTVYQRKGKCQHIDTNNNHNDFEVATVTTPLNSLATSCIK